MTKLFIMIFVLQFALLDAAMASPFGFSKGSLALKLDSSYLNSSRNYDIGGNLSIVNATNSVTEYRYGLTGIYDLSNTWGVHSTLTYKQFSTRTSFNNLSVSGLSDLSVGTDFL